MYIVEALPISNILVFFCIILIDLLLLLALHSRHPQIPNIYFCEYT